MGERRSEVRGEDRQRWEGVGKERKGLHSDTKTF